MERFILKHKMKKLIQVLGGLGICFTLVIGIVGFVMSSKITESANYIYSYKRYSKLVHEIHNNFLNVKNSELINLASGDTTKFKEDLQKADEVIRANLDKYNATDYEEEEEENYIKNITSAYEGYYNIIIDFVNQYENGKEMPPEVSTEIEKYEDILVENVNGVTEYLDYWATNDMDAINLDNKKTKIEYGLIIAISIAIFSLMAASIIKIFSRESKIINDSLKEIAEGNLVVELECNNNTEFDEMKSSINKTVENFEAIIKGIKEKTSDIDEKAENLSTVSSDLSAAVQNAHLAIENITNSTGEQANDLSDVNSILNKFSKSISEFIESITFLDSNANMITNKANESSSKMDELAAAFRHVDELIKSFTHKITDLNKTVGEISGITNFINDIAEQTNLLALNAAIESARVGEAGKGFAVVADQIRTLAEQSKESANNITKLISDVSKGTNEIAKDGDTVNERLNSSMFIINDSLRSFNEIIEAIEDVAEKIGHLNSASKVINEEKDSIHKKVEKSSDIAAEIVASSEEVLSSISEVNSSSKNVQDTSINLSEVTNVLEKEIQIFKTK